MYVCLLHLPDFASHSDGLKRQILPSKETAVNRTARYEICSDRVATEA
jgi:hypothetical protein